MIGQIVNYRYEVLEKIGDGEMFSAYRARDKVLNRLVALKVLNNDLAAQEDFAAAVVAGYQEVVSLTHGAIARVFDAECSPQSCFVATEYARGINVKERIHRAGPISVPLALDIIIPVMEALEYAHANKVVHGDIRSNDIIVSPDGEVKLTDFGLSSALTSYPGVADKYRMRSVHYQAPEVVEGGVPTPASDLYSIGVVLYEMVTGTVPFEGTTAMAVALKKVKDAPTPPRSINAAVTKTLNEVILRALEKDPENRYARAGDMLADLRVIRDAMRVGQAPQIAGPASAARHAEAEHEEPVEAGERSLKSQFLLLFALFVVVVIVLGGATMYMNLHNKEVRIPPLLGKTMDEANAAVKDLGITLEDDGEMYCDNYNTGQICFMAPPAETMAPSNTVIKIKISKGPRACRCRTLRAARNRMRIADATEAGFIIGKVTDQYNDKVPVNSVISQDPAAGTKKGTGLAYQSGYKPRPEADAESLLSEGESARQSQRAFRIFVTVPANADGAQDVRVVTIDDNGENTAYEQVHEPGERFTTTVTASRRFAGDKGLRGRQDGQRPNLPDESLSGGRSDAEPSSVAIPQGCGITYSSANATAMLF